MRSTSRTWSYPSGRQVWEVIEDPTTPAWALLELPVLSYRTLEAYASAAFPAARSPEVLRRTISIVSSADSLAWYDRHELPASAGKEAIAELLLSHEVLSTEDLLNLVPYLGLTRSAGSLAAHPSVTPAVLVAATLHTCAGGSAMRVMALTAPEYPDSFRILAAVAAAFASGPSFQPLPDARLLHEALERLLPLEGSADTLAGLYTEWFGRPAELVNLVEQLCS